ncbi:MAG: hypothetical protein JKY52_13235 [Flavobacteriales bacterium]|nr:hypothetical protein [Flavobacteriales bacterium]
MKRKLLSIALALVTTCSFAQLSERENDATMIKLGARPQAGDMSLTFGFDLGGSLDSNAADAALFTGNFFAKGDFLTFKWYQSDDIVIRAAIRLSKHSSKLDGNLADTAGFFAGESGGNFESRANERNFVFVPGIEKHFSSSNVFDVYSGADLFLGFGVEDSTYRREYGKGSTSLQFTDEGDLDSYSEKTKNTIVGIGGVVGFNVFIAHLPISIGLEYGINLKWTLGGKTEVTREQIVAGKKTDKQVYFLDSDDPGSLKFRDGLKKSRFDMDTNQDVRAVLNIYFNR